MSKASLRIASISCLAIWAAIWFLFLLMRLLPFDVRGIPDAGMVMLTALAVALAAPIVATGVAGAVLVRGPRTSPDLLIFGCAIAALLGQVFLFLISRWL
jgi:predicted secreted protein